ncbi:MAG: pyruvate kinase, partial [Oscillospiraceae bacterium]|nr:pyruvate kinase [Oscillospiraceae bacterium]
MRKTKIVCTLGPSTDDPEILRTLLLSGMNVARLNMSHQDHESHRRRIEQLVAMREELNLPAAVLLDTKGPEIRLGIFEKPVELKNGQKYVLTTKQVECTDKIAYISYAGLPKDVRSGGHILIDDGLIDLVIEVITGTEIHCRVAAGGKVSSR